MCVIDMERKQRPPGNKGDIHPYYVKRKRVQKDGTIKYYNEKVNYVLKQTHVEITPEMREQIQQMLDVQIPKKKICETFGISYYVLLREFGVYRREDPPE